jgi:hypothetical protein
MHVFLFLLCFKFKLNSNLSLLMRRCVTLTVSLSSVGEVVGIGMNFGVINPGGIKAPHPGFPPPQSPHPYGFYPRCKSLLCTCRCKVLSSRGMVLDQLIHSNTRGVVLDRDSRITKGRGREGLNRGRSKMRSQLQLQTIPSSLRIRVRHQMIRDPRLYLSTLQKWDITTLTVELPNSASFVRQLHTLEENALSGRSL